jgi:hypothetical protein
VEGVFSELRPNGIPRIPCRKKGRDPNHPDPL